MKTLYIIRHAKSSWGDFTTPDFDRPLNERGKTDAPQMAKRLLAQQIKIDAFVSSPAKRAKKTCKLFCEAYGVSEDQVIYVENLYQASAETISIVVSKLDDKYDHVAVFAHNPGVTDFSNSLCKEVQIDQMPTCGIFAVEAPVNNWSAFKVSNKKFLFFEYPKSGRNS